VNSHTPLYPNDTVVIVGDHPWQGEQGTLVAFEEYGLGWCGWRVSLNNGTECYADGAKVRKVR
jgi:hypothetical protein